MIAMLMGFLLKLPGLADGLFTYLNKKSDNTVLVNGQNVNADTILGQAQLAAYIEESKINADRRKSDGESLWTAWMMPTLFAVCLLHFSGIVFDSMCLLGHEVGSWRIARLPEPYSTLELGVLGAAAGLKTVHAVGSVVKKIFTK